MAAGVNEVDVLIKCLFGEKIPEQKFKRKLIMTRYEDQIFFNEKDIV